MGHEYCSSARLHSQNLQHHHNNHQRSTPIFLPLLCSRPSIIKDVQYGLPRKPIPSKSSTTTDPLSPKISCIGQVKRKNKVVVFPNPHNHKALTTNNNNNKNRTSVVTNNNNVDQMIINSSIVSNGVVKYAKLKKFFSSKNLTGAGTGGAAGEVGRGHVAGEGAKGSCGCECKSGNCDGVISIVDLDPPLPVVKRRPIEAQQGSEAESLWKRRSGGATLKGLQIHQLHHPRHHLQPTTV